MRNCDLFRGKRLDNGEWIVGCLLQYPDETLGISMASCFANYRIDPDTIGRCSGLEGKNGLLFEGDICKHLHWPEDRNPLAALLAVIEFKNAAWGYRYLYPELHHEDDREWCPFWQDEGKEMRDSDCFEIIGNIHGNPELLTEATCTN